jgi:hypothetical protein
MLFSQRQHVKMASLLEVRSETNSDPAKAEKQVAMANLFRFLAQRAATYKSYDRQARPGRHPGEVGVPSITRKPVRPAIERSVQTRALNVLIVKLSH